MAAVVSPFQPHSSFHCICRNPSLEREHFATCQPLIGQSIG